MNVVWVLIRSWHAIRPDGEKTRCGRKFAAFADQVDALPSGRSCESCLRSLARMADAA